MRERVGEDLAGKKIKHSIHVIPRADERACCVAVEVDQTSFMRRRTAVDRWIEYEGSDGIKANGIDPKRAAGGTMDRAADGMGWRWDARAVV